MDTITADRAVSRVSRLSEHIDDGELAIADKIDAFVDQFVYDGCFSSAWGSSAERNALCRLAAKAAIRVVLEAAALPEEVQWLHLDRDQDAAEIDAARLAAQ
jgi:hypothetical protein